MRKRVVVIPPIAVAIGGIIAIALLAPDSACARGGGRGGGRPAAHAFHPSGGFPAFKRFHRSNDLAARYRRFHRFRYPYWWPNGGLLYGAYYDPLGAAPPYDPLSDGVDLAPPWPVSRDVPFVIYRPSCRLQTQTRVVPSEAGGERQITITRCMSGLNPSTLGLDNASYRRLAGPVGVPTELSDDGEGAASTDQAIETDGITRRSCQEQTRLVPSHDGGDRTIIIRRC